MNDIGSEEIVGRSEALEQLVRQAKNGDREAFLQLYELFVDRVYKHTYYKTGDHHEAEDLTAAIFAHLMENIRKYEDKGKPWQAWFWTMVHNMTINYLERDYGKRRNALSLDNMFSLSSGQKSPEDIVVDATMWEERWKRVMEIVGSIGDSAVRLLELRMEEKSNREIADILSEEERQVVSEQAVKSRWFRITSKLEGIFGHQ